MIATNKREKVDNLLEKLSDIAKTGIKKKHYEKAMAAMAASARIQYMYNQTYTDTVLENNILKIAKIKKEKYLDRIKKMKIQNNTVLFYDGFGLDTRGVAIMYLNALAKNDYHIVYVTKNESKEQQPEIQKILCNANVTWEYISMRNSYSDWMERLTNIIIETEPKALFFYTTPNDVAGAISFAMFENICDRYLIDLTDHAFWIGTKTNDFFLGSREMSASNQYFRRHIPKEKLIKLGVNLIVEEGEEHSGLPFNVEQERYIFSGGSLYKTLGDENNTFYRIVDHVLEKHNDIKFLYAGNGDKIQMEHLLKKYPERAFLIDERKDFFYLIKNCTLYLNTYPMFGGMMMKYSALAGKIPITLKHSADSDGLLLNQKQVKIEYNSYEELLNDMDRLLSDGNYLKEREALLEGTVITEERFVNNVRGVIEEHKTDYEHEIVEIDTSEFQKEFYERFDYKKERDGIVNYINRSLYSSMPWMLWVAIKKVVYELLKKREKKNG